MRTSATSSRGSKFVRKGQEPSRTGMPAAKRTPDEEPKLGADDLVEAEELVDKLNAQSEVESLIEDLPDEELEKVAAAEEKKEAKASASRGKVVPAKRDKDKKSAVSKAAAKAKPDEDEEEGEDADGEDGPRSRRQRRADLSSRKLATASRRLKKEDADEEEEDEEEAKDSASSRRSRRASAAGSSRGSRRSVREQKPSGPLLSKKAMVGIGAVVVLILGAVIAYKPVMKSMLISKLDTGESLDVRKKAAADLFAWLGSGSLGTFMDRLRGTYDADTYAAAAHGLELAARGGKKEARAEALNYVKEVFASAPEEGKLALVQTLPGVAEFYAGQTDKDGKFTAESKEAMHGLALVALPLVGEAGAAVTPLRLAALQSASKLVAPGVCAKLIQIAKSEQGETRNLALAGIPSTALPDACGDLLRNMTDKEDTALAKACVQGFSKVRDEAPTGDLLPVLKENDPQVRLEIISALSKRTGDAAAKQAVLGALNDSSKDVRVVVVKTVPALGLPPEALKALEPRITDESEEVRLATAETLKGLGDDVTWGLVLGSFKKGLSGKTLTAFVDTLGSRGRSYNKKKQSKDRQALAIGMELLSNHSDLGKKALVQLTMEGGSAKREQERSQWDVGRWNEWYQRLQKRDQLEAQAMTILNEARQYADMKFKSEFPKWGKKAEEGVTILEKAAELCEPDDGEDKWQFDKKVQENEQLKYHFFKNQSLDLAR
ncbi:MAG: HEAT repeat domain-containing protein [Planctomycetes bacterium]|nr:HEAT repeat domain-containing protein [Planctomycetota bacterium]